jgi:hypothetical protein
MICSKWTSIENTIYLLAQQTRISSMRLKNVIWTLRKVRRKPSYVAAQRAQRGCAVSAKIDGKSMTTLVGFYHHRLMTIHDRILAHSSPREPVHSQSRLRRDGSEFAKQLADLVCPAQRAVHLRNAHRVSDLEVHI